MTSQERLIKLCNIREALRRAHLATGVTPGNKDLVNALEEALADINVFILEEKNGSTREA